MLGLVQLPQVGQIQVGRVVEVGDARKPMRRSDSRAATKSRRCVQYRRTCSTGCSRVAESVQNTDVRRPIKRDALATTA